MVLSTKCQDDLYLCYPPSDLGKTQGAFMLHSLGAETQCWVLQSATLSS